MSMEPLLKKKKTHKKFNKIVYSMSSFSKYQPFTTTHHLAHLGHFTNVFFEFHNLYSLQLCFADVFNLCNSVKLASSWLPLQVRQQPKVCKCQIQAVQRMAQHTNIESLKELCYQTGSVLSSIVLMQDPNVFQIQSFRGDVFLQLLKNFELVFLINFFFHMVHNVGKPHLRHRGRPPIALQQSNSAVVPFF